MSVEQRKLAKRIAALEAQAAAQARASQGRNRTIVNGALRFVDGTGQVRQVVGLQTDGTVTTRDLNAPAPPRPTPPILTPIPGGVRIAWDGTFLDAAAPTDLREVRVHVSHVLGDPATSLTHVTSLVSLAGGVYNHYVLPEAGPVHVKLVALNTSGVKGEPSDEVTATALPFLEAGYVKVTATGPGVHELVLSHAPLEDSVHLYWNGVDQADGVDWTIEGRLVTFPDTEGYLVAGNTLEAKYLYPSGVDPVALPVLPVEFVHAQAQSLNNPISYPMTGAQAGDLILLAVVSNESATDGGTPYPFVVPPGYTMLLDASTGATLKQLYTKVCTTADETVSIETTAFFAFGDRLASATAVYRNARVVDSDVALGADGNGNNLPLPSVDMPQGGTLVGIFGNVIISGNDTVVMAPLTQRANSGNNRGSIAVADIALPAGVTSASAYTTTGGGKGPTAASFAVALEGVSHE